MKVIIIGGGETGITLANLLGEEHDVTIIEKEEELAKDLANKTSALIIKGDATDLSILKQAEIEKADAIVLATNDDKTNLMLCEIAKTEKVKKIISLVNIPKNEELFTKLGVNRLVSVVGTNVTGIRKMLYKYGEERIIAQLGGGETQIIEQTISKKSRLVGKSPKIKKATVAAVYRSGEIIIPTEKTSLKEGDVLIVAVKTKDLPDVSDLITGK
jgi:trk system potassium uptake protein TrkA